MTNYKLKKPLSYIHHDKFSTPIQEALVSKEGTAFLTEPTSEQVSVMKFLNEVWDDKNFNDTNLPDIIGTLTQEQKYAFAFRNNIRILDMPIKFPKSNEFRCPYELKQFESIIKQIASHELAMNPRIDDYYCYITIDQKIVEKGNPTRKPHLHVDGFQGARIEKPLPIDHSYIIYSAEPTLFYNQTFEVLPHWSKSCHNYFDGFSKQIKPDTLKTYNPFEILLINAYCLHEAPVVNQKLYRTFFRMTYTVREFDRTGNAHNPMFNYSWDMQHRDIQDYLVDPDFSICDNQRMYA